MFFERLPLLVILILLDSKTVSVNRGGAAVRLFIYFVLNQIHYNVDSSVIVRILLFKKLVINKFDLNRKLY